MTTVLGSTQIDIQITWVKGDNINQAPAGRCIMNLSVYETGGSPVITATHQYGAVTNVPADQNVIYYQDRWAYPLFNKRTMTVSFQELVNGQVQSNSYMPAAFDPKPALVSLVTAGSSNAGIWQYSTVVLNPASGASTTIGETVTLKYGVCVNILPTYAPPSQSSDYPITPYTVVNLRAYWPKWNSGPLASWIQAAQYIVNNTVVVSSTFTTVAGSATFQTANSSAGTAASFQIPYSTFVNSSVTTTFTASGSPTWLPSTFDATSGINTALQSSIAGNGGDSWFYAVCFGTTSQYSLAYIVGLAEVVPPPPPPPPVPVPVVSANGIVVEDGMEFLIDEFDNSVQEEVQTIVDEAKRELAQRRPFMKQRESKPPVSENIVPDSVDQEMEQIDTSQKYGISDRMEKVERTIEKPWRPSPILPGANALSTENLLQWKTAESIAMNYARESNMSQAVVRPIDVYRVWAQFVDNESLSILQKAVHNTWKAGGGDEAASFETKINEIGTLDGGFTQGVSEEVNKLVKGLTSEDPKWGNPVSEFWNLNTDDAMPYWKMLTMSDRYAGNRPDLKNVLTPVPTNLLERVTNMGGHLSRKTIKLLIADLNQEDGYQTWGNELKNKKGSQLELNDLTRKVILLFNSPNTPAVVKEKLDHHLQRDPIVQAYFASALDTKKDHVADTSRTLINLVGYAGLLKLAAYSTGFGPLVALDTAFKWSGLGVGLLDAVGINTGLSQLAGLGDLVFGAPMDYGSLNGALMYDNAMQDFKDATVFVQQIPDKYKFAEAFLKEVGDVVSPMVDELPPEMLKELASEASWDVWVRVLNQLPSHVINSIEESGLGALYFDRRIAQASDPLVLYELLKLADNYPDKLKAFSYIPLDEWAKRGLIHPNIAPDLNNKAFNLLGMYPSFSNMQQDANPFVPNANELWEAMPINDVPLSTWEKLKYVFSHNKGSILFAVLSAALSSYKMYQWYNAETKQENPQLALENVMMADSIVRNPELTSEAAKIYSKIESTEHDMRKAYYADTVLALPGTTNAYNKKEDEQTQQLDAITKTVKAIGASLGQATHAPSLNRVYSGSRSNKAKVYSVLGVRQHRSPTDIGAFLEELAEEAEFEKEKQRRIKRMKLF